MIGPNGRAVRDIRLPTDVIDEFLRERAREQAFTESVLKNLSREFFGEDEPDEPDEHDATPLEQVQPADPLRTMLEAVRASGESVTVAEAAQTLLALPDVSNQQRAGALAQFMSLCWSTIVEAIGVTGAHALVDEVAADPDWTDYPDELTGEQTRLYVAKHYARQLLALPRTP